MENPIRRRYFAGIEMELFHVKQEDWSETPVFLFFSLPGGVFHKNCIFFLKFLQWTLQAGSALVIMAVVYGPCAALVGTFSAGG